MVLVVIMAYTVIGIAVLIMTVMRAAIFPTKNNFVVLQFFMNAVVNFSGFIMVFQMPHSYMHAMLLKYLG